MGGLVQAGRQIARHLKAAIDLGQAMLERSRSAPSTHLRTSTNAGSFTGPPATAAC